MKTSLKSDKNDLFEKSQNKAGIFKSVSFKLIMLFLFISGFSKSYAQNSDREEYMIATISGSFYNIKLFIDYNPDNIEKKPKVEKDSSGNPILFASKSAALNYIAKQGWLILHPISDNQFPGNNGDAFIFKRNVTGLKNLKNINN
jgi:hypothetical protein